ncbi:MAG: TRAP transporter TatT component family protein [Myxococcaceae bacterium]
MKLYALASLLLVLTGCRGIATGALADAMSGTGGSLASDDDPELVRDAAPFGLKTMESLLPEQPHHIGLLTALTSGFTQYSYAFVQQEADAAELDGKSARAKPLKLRAKKLFLRARDYGLRGLDESQPGVSEKLKSMQNLDAACAGFKKEDVPLLYWTAAAWALAISDGKEEMEMVSQLPAPGALAKRALELDESWEQGTLHDFMVSYETSRPGGSEAEAKKHLDRAMELSKGHRLGVQVSWAEGPLVQGQKRKEFEASLNSVVGFDVDSVPAERLANTIAQRRARSLLSHADDLFNN